MQLTSVLRRRLLSREHSKLSCVEAGPAAKLDRMKGKEKMDHEWFGLPGQNQEKTLKHNNDGWWRLWDVSADCREIGGMECYGELTDLVSL